MSNVVICHPDRSARHPAGVVNIDDLVSLADQASDRRDTEDSLPSLGLFICRTSAASGNEARIEVTSLTLAGVILAFARESGYADHEVATTQWSRTVWNVVTPSGRVLGVVLGETV